MGGKHKQAQRTKDNAKPSSSGRSAALLSNTSSHFGAVKECGYVPIFPCLPATTSEELDPTIDSNFQLVLKKMNKKDSTTRLKGLQEFSKLVESSDLEAVKAVLPFWPRLYCLLAGAIEHRVREAAQEAHRTMVVRTKRYMAPYLRQLAGPWFTAQFDTYPPVASTATRAFQEAFPPNKLVEAVMFCQEETLQYICDSLLGQYTQFANTSKNPSVEKLNAKQQHIVVSCLQGFAMYLRMLPMEKLPEVATLQINQELVGSKRFWELASDKSSTVRSAWMTALTAILELVPSLVAERHTQVVEAVLTRLDEPEPSVLPYVWEAALHVLSTIQNWETYGSTDKVLLPSLWRVLREAGHGSAAAIFPNLLPVLSCLLKTCKTQSEKDDLCNQFFSNLREGFTKKSVMQSRAERVALAQCYMECLRYVASDSCSHTSLANQNLISAVELTLTKSELNLLSKSLFEHMSTLAHYWSRNRSMEQFWTDLLDMYRRLLTSFDEVGSKTLTQLVELCLCFKTSGRQKKKKVRFGGSPPESTTPTEELPSEVFQQELRTFVHQVCLLYMNEVKNCAKLSYIVPLSRLVANFNSRELFEELAFSHNPLQLFDATLQGWLCDGNQYQQATIELAFCLLPHLEADDKDYILQSMCQMSGMLMWVVRGARQHHSEPHVLQWLRGSWLSGTLITMARDVGTDNEAPHAKAVLRDCVAMAQDGGMLVSMDTISAILTELSQNAVCADFAAEVLLTVCHSSQVMSSALAESMRKLVLALFIICCQTHTEHTLRTAWQEGLKLLVEMDSAALVPELSNTVKQELLAKGVSSTEDICHLVQIAASVIAIISPVHCSTFLAGLLPEQLLWEEQLSSLCIDAEQLAGALGAGTTNYRHSADIEIAKYVTLSLFTVKLVSQVVFKQERKTEADGGLQSEDIGEQQEQRDSVDESEDDLASCSVDEESLTLALNNILCVVCSLAISIIFEKHYQSTFYYNKISLHLPSLKLCFAKMATVLRGTSFMTQLEDTATEKAKQSGGVWIWARYLLCDSDEQYAAYQAVGSSEYAAQVLAQRHMVALCSLGDSPRLSILTNWLRHPDNSLIDIHADLLIAPLDAWPQLDHNQLLHDCDVSVKPWTEVERVSEMIHHLAACVAKCPQLVTQHLWDFVLVSTAYYIQSLKRSQEYLFPSKDRDNVLEAPSLRCCSQVCNVAVFTIAVCDLYISLAQYVLNVGQDQELAREWKAVFADDAHQTLLDIYTKISGYMKDVKPSLVGHQLLQSLSSALSSLDVDYFASEDKLTKQQEQSVLGACCQLIHSSVAPLQVASYHVLKKLLARLVYADTKYVSTLDSEDVEASTLNIHPLLEKLDDTQAVVDSMLTDFRFGDSCIVQPHTDSHSYTTAYLLVWDLLLDACAQAGSELRYQYANVFKSSGCLQTLLYHLFFLMPAEVLEPSSPRLVPGCVASMFQDAASPVSDSPRTSKELQHWACWVYYNTLRRLPALVRQWWSDTKPKVNTVVQRATYQYVTPLLCNSELQAIQSNDTRLKNMLVKVHSRAREVVAVYAVDETRMELMITLPEVYPLGSVQVNSHAPLVGTNQWRNWVRQLSMFLTHQNGSVWDGLLLWKSNLDKRFEGVEECYICFSILHGTNFQIPKLCCKTCKKKFHSPCLYKWFSTSNKSTCPICRNMF